jgi:hypothetical protein
VVKLWPQRIDALPTVRVRRESVRDSATNDAGVKLLVFYHLLPALDGRLPRNLFTQGVDAVRNGEWTVADVGSLHTMPIGSTEIRRGAVVDR